MLCSIPESISGTAKDLNFLKWLAKSLAGDEGKDDFLHNLKFRPDLVSKVIWSNLLQWLIEFDGGHGATIRAAEKDVPNIIEFLQQYFADELTAITE
jgi:hypothetical protein